MSRRPKKRTLRNILTGLIALLLTTALSFLLGWYRASTVPRLGTSIPAPPAHRTNTLTEPSRKLYPYSVVSGGLASQNELEAVVQKDAVVRTHYADLRPASFRPQVLPKDQQGYVSYRVRDRIFWSRRLMTIKKGETVLTDGHTLLRGRCGNRISPIPMEPTAPTALEPPEAVLDSSVDTRRLNAIPHIPSPSPIENSLRLVRPTSAEPSVPPLLAPLQPEFTNASALSNSFAPFGVWTGSGQARTGGSTGDAPAPATPDFPVIAPPFPPGALPSAPPTVVLAPSGVPPEEIGPLTPEGPSPPLNPETPAPPPTSPIPGIIPSPFPPGPPTTPFAPTPVPLPLPPTPYPNPNPGPTPTPTSEPPPFNPPPFAPPIQENPVPEPSTLLLVAASLALLGAKSYRDRRRP